MELYSHKKDKGEEDFHVLKIILNSADRDAPSSLAASLNGPFLYI